MNIRSTVTAQPATEHRQPVERQQHGDDGQIAAIDMLIAEEGIFDYDVKQINKMRLEFIRQAVEWHMRMDSPYSDYAIRQGFKLDMLNNPNDLALVPVMPSMLFKRPNISIVHPETDETFLTTSSGTKGSVSRIPRDDATLRRFFASIGNLSNEMLEIENSDITVFNLGPDAEEARNLWISYVMAGITVMLPRSSYYVREDIFCIEDLIADLQEIAGERIAVIGPPPLLLQLSDTLLKRKIKLNLRSDSILVTIGGWKRRSGERVSRDKFNEKLSSAFHLPERQIRDTFNMVELNSVLIECDHGRLHIPSWLSVCARDPATLKVLPSATSGILSYLDPTAVSYPCFLLSDDLGVVEKSVECGCGRHSDILKIERRLNTMESRGCALKMDTYEKI